jgi:NAD(P)H dehydrogenase (quinone)
MGGVGSDMTILITASTGQLGRLVIDALRARGADAARLVAGARSVEKGADLAATGVRVVELDYDRPETVRAAMDGVDTVLLISGSQPGGRIPQHQAVIDAAAEAGVAKLVYTSAPFATTTDLLVNPDHKGTEELIAASGVPAVIVRNNWYHENFLPAAQAAAATGALVDSWHGGRVASASRADYAEAAAVVLLEDGHEGSVYELAGDVAWAQGDLAAAITEITGAAVEARDVTTDEQTAALTAAGLDAGTIGFLTGLDRNIADGHLAFTDGTLSRLIGRATTPLVQGLRDAGLQRVE